MRKRKEKILEAIGEEGDVKIMRSDCGIGKTKQSNRGEMKTEVI